MNRVVIQLEIRKGKPAAKQGWNATVIIEENARSIRRNKTELPWKVFWPFATYKLSGSKGLAADCIICAIMKMFGSEMNKVSKPAYASFEDINEA